MRMRRKPWARPELEACPFYIAYADTTKHRGRWRALFKKDAPLWLELGCGKGVSTARLVADSPTRNFVAVDIKSEVLVLAKRNIEAAFSARGEAPGNVLVTSFDVERIADVFSRDDRVAGIYINFCNPWPKPRHHKRRLTHTRQLRSYAGILVPGGRIFFKTDDAGFYRDTLGYLKEAGYAVDEATDDYYAAGVPQDAALSEHERMFLDEGKHICFIAATRGNLNAYETV
ncbi:MAG: tRNA (guanosine(46)-N7)-methyltransferase TrmB [Oscillospiraceae bacterium]|nr:tRNA (guanosine(46)-N7)-methyltransferase TrmB [Oscillospiraceae bacterium]